MSYFEFLIASEPAEVGNDPRPAGERILRARHGRVNIWGMGLLRWRPGLLVVREKRRSLPASSNGHFSDYYHHLLRSSWPLLLLQVACGFVAVNVAFATGYLIDGGVANARPGSFADVFFFSIETMATIGYGQMTPVTFVARVLMSLEALTGLIGFAMVTGLIFAKFSQPTARVRFSRNAVISLRDGVPSLMFRMANVRANQIVDARIHVVFAQQEHTAEGEEVRRFHDLELKRYRNAIFAYSWTAIHPIRPGSPFFGATREALIAADANLTVSLTGIDETFSQTIYARHSYDAEDLVWGARLADIHTHMPDGALALDLSRFDEIVPAEMNVPARVGADIRR